MADRIYHDEIVSNLLVKEKQRKLDGVNDIYVYRRERLIDQMTLISMQCNVLYEVLHLAIYFLDFFSMKNVSLKDREYCLCAMCSLFIAAKVEENRGEKEEMDLCFKNLCLISKHVYSMKEMCEMEKEILLFFDWKLLMPTVASFIEMFRRDAVSNNDIIENPMILNTFENFQKFEDYFHMTLIEILNSIVKEQDFNVFTPSSLAAAIIAFTRKKFNLKTIWPHKLKKKYTKILPDFDCLLFLQQFDFEVILMLKASKFI